MTPLLGFTPDAPTTAEGIILDCSDWIPFEAGMKAAPSATAQGASAVAAATRGAATVTKLDGSRRVFAGTTAKLYELSGTTFTDRTRAVGGDYALGAGVRWSFVQFGDTTYASNIDTVVQKSTTGAFADLATAPKAKILESLVTSGGGFVFAFNTIDAGFGTSPDRWWCTSLNDGDVYTVNPSVTQANSGRLLGAEGPITAAKKLGSDMIVAYKDRSIYVGRYVGPPVVWQFTEIPSVGCVGPDAIVDIGTAHIFVGQDNIYLFDGTRPISIADGRVRQWFQDNCSVDYKAYTQVVFDRDQQLIGINFARTGSGDGSLDTSLVYHIATKQWGRADRRAETFFVYNAPSVTYDTLTGTYDTQTGSYDSVAAGARVLAYFDTSHVLQLMTGTPGSSYFTLHDIGDDTLVSRLEEVTLRYMTTPTTASISAFSSMATGGVPSVGPTQSAYDVPANGKNKFQLRQTARWHRTQYNFTGPCEVVGYGVTGIRPAGKR